MGYIKNHVIVVTSTDLRRLRDAKQEADKIFRSVFGGCKLVSNIVKHPIEGGGSFFIAPDGSKEGWVDSNIGDDARLEFIEWINRQAYSDGSNSIRYVELSFGGDDKEAELLDYNYKIGELRQ